MNREYFARLCMDLAPGQKVLLETPGGIGVLSEKTMHRVVKSYMEIRSEFHEIKIGRYVADIKNEFGVIEIQTRALYRLKPKLEAFLPEYPVMVVCPLAAEKYVSWIDMETGQVGRRHKSPKHESFFTLGRELYTLRDYLSHPHFSLCLLMIQAEEFRYLNGWGKDKKRGSERCDRIPLALLDEKLLKTPGDYAYLIPEGLPRQFTTNEFAKAAKVSARDKWYATALLERLGLLRECGKRKKEKLFELV